MTSTNELVKPAEQYEDPKLGVMVFESDDNTWLGHFNGYGFSITRGDDSTPHSDLLHYCFEILSKKQWLESTLVQKKDKRKAYSSPVFHAEVDSLSFHNFMFYRDEDKLHLLVQFAVDRQLSHDEEERQWFIEAVGDNWGRIDFNY